MRKPADHQGLSLIPGGAEGTRWDITGGYASMARTLNNYFLYAGKERYAQHDLNEPVFFKQTAGDEEEENQLHG